MNLLKTRNFLDCVSLRAGTLMVLWTTSLGCLCLFFVNLLGNDAFSFVGIAVLFVGELLSVFALINFPAPNITYSPKSKTAKLLKYTAWYYGFYTAICVIEVLGLFLTAIFEYIKEDDEDDEDDNGCFSLAAVCVLSVWIVGFIHFMAVVYSFYLSILPMRNVDFPLDDVNVISHDNL